MKWGKIILIFQAVLTLIIGIFLLVMVFNIEYQYEDKVKEEYSLKNISSIIAYEQLIKYETFKKRFFNASYILVLVSIIELVLLWRLLDDKSISAEYSLESDFTFRES